jgi:trehalose 6-phosphate synthase/phosphatase
MVAPTTARRDAPPLDVWRRAPELALLLDYDGTLVPFAPRPELAAPDEPLLALLGALAERPRTEVHLVSGRDRPTLERWFGHLRLGLHAEHGFWSRPAPDAPWRSLPDVPDDWKPRVRPLLERRARDLPGALVEEKSVSLGWHYRAAHDRAAALAAAGDLAARLRAELAGGPLELLEGDCVLEVRVRGVHKGRAVAALVASWPPGSKTAVAIGDDRTDEDMFAALPPGAFAVRVGDGPSSAALRLASPRHVRETLEALTREAGPPSPSSAPA